MSIDNRYQLHSNWRFLGSTPRECKGFEPPANRGDRWVIFGCLVLVAIAATWPLV